MKLSVVISVFNEQDTISECLSSLFRQDRLPDEVIIVDNNCSDNSIQIIKQFKVKIVTESQQGIWKARHTGYDAATGEIIICTDADARFKTTWLQDIESHFLKEDYIAIAGPGIFYDCNKFAGWLGDKVYMKPYFNLVGLALGQKPLFGSNMAFRRSAWLAIRHETHCTETVFDDIDLSYHLTKIGKLVYCPDISNFISIRPLKSVKGMMRRYTKGFRSVLIHWPEQAPWRNKVDI